MVRIYRGTKKLAIEKNIFKAYDIRGRYPKELNEATASAIAGAYCAFLRPRTVVLGRDVRMSGPALFRATKQAILESGVNVIDVGVVPVDVFYFGVASLKADGGIFISASHNPREWNGMNLAKRGAKPISSDSGLREITRLAQNGTTLRRKKKGKVSKKDIVKPYLSFVYKLSPIRNPKPLKIVINGSFGVSAQIFRKLVKKFRLPFRLIGLDDKPNGRFPKGPPNPHLPQRRIEMTKLVVRKKADIGIAWDADGDRSFFVDEKGNFLDGYFTTAILAEEILNMHPRATILIDPRLVWATRGVVKKTKGRLVIGKPGMTIIAERMKKEKAVFAGETSGHFYFRKTFNRDSGILPSLLILNMMLSKNKKLSELLRPFAEKYFISGEINFHLKNRDGAKKIFEKIKRVHKKGKLSYVDGASVEYPRWRFNVRASNTEPLLRLNLEAKDRRVLNSELKKIKQLLSAYVTRE